MVVACNTASTLVLGPLRARFSDLPFVGTVPAIKPAALASRSRLLSVLATPGTVARDYTRGLIREFAGDCEVTLVGSRRLAGLAERALRGEPVADTDIAAEIAPAFVERDGRRTDQIVLACTHFPLLCRAHRARSRRGRPRSSIPGRRSRGGSTRCSGRSGRAARANSSRAHLHQRRAGAARAAKSLARARPDD